MTIAKFSVSNIPANTAAILRLNAPAGIVFSGPIPDEIELRASAENIPDLSTAIDIKIIVDLAQITKYAFAAWLVSKASMFVARTKIHGHGQNVVLEPKAITKNIDRQITNETTDDDGR